MNNIEEYLHLFQKVEDGLPEFDGHYYCVAESRQECGNTWIVQTTIVMANNMWLIDNQNKIKVTHWLRLDRLTTKELSIHFAKTAVLHEKTANGNGLEYIEKEKDIL